MFQESVLKLLDLLPLAHTARAKSVHYYIEHNITLCLIVVVVRCSLRTQTKIN